MPHGSDLSASYVVALEIVDDVVAGHGLNDNRPPLLHHYTSLESGLGILTRKDLRLSHCEYLNDADEIKEAIDIVRQDLEKQKAKALNINRREHDFYENVLSRFDARASLYEAFVFCMSEGDLTKSLKQDVLSFWRAYGREGRGLCLSFDSQAFATFNGQKTECRLSRVIYDDILQGRIVRDIVDRGWTRFNRAATPNDAIEAAVIALIFMMPTMKHHSFSEEKEWRFVYVPSPSDPTVSSRMFHAGAGGLLVPYYTMRSLCDEAAVPMPHVMEIMVGPSPHQGLNVRSLDFIRDGATVRTSEIPYRSS